MFNFCILLLTIAFLLYRGQKGWLRQVANAAQLACATDSKLRNSTHHHISYATYAQAFSMKHAAYCFLKQYSTVFKRCDKLHDFLPDKAPVPNVSQVSNDGQSVATCLFLTALSEVLLLHRLQLLGQETGSNHVKPWKGSDGQNCVGTIVGQNASGFLTTAIAWNAFSFLGRVTMGLRVCIECMQTRGAFCDRGLPNMQCTKDHLWTSFVLFGRHSSPTQAVFWGTLT